MDWVEIVDPQTHRTFFANTTTGDCSWERPDNVQIRQKDPSLVEWWELFDSNHKLPYYYNTKTGQTEWVKPKQAYIVSLIALQRAAGTTGFPSPKHQQQVASNPQSQQQQAAGKLVDSSHEKLQMNQPANNSQAAAQEALPIQPQASQRQQQVVSGSAPLLHQNNPQQQKQNAVVVGSSNKIAQSTNNLAGRAKSKDELSTLPDQLLDDISRFKLEGFASKYFATHKKGIFRKRVPLVKMLKFTKDAIPQPLMSMNKELHKEAIKNFKLVQKVMGDRAGPSKSKNGSNSDDIQEILTSGINHGEMRDEIYCQVCRQLTENPTNESQYKGWELMSALVVTFPPSKNFEFYLEQFMGEHSESPDSKIVIFAKHCAVKLERIAKKGPRGKVPTIPEIDRAKEAPFSPSVFGESLNDVMQSQKTAHPSRKLPMIMTFLTEGILVLNGCQTEGIFRVPGDADQITDLRLRLEKNVYDLSGIHDASVPASLLKFWLRDLTDPLIPHDLYDYCIKNAENAEKAIDVLQKIPEHNQNVLMYLINFLQVVGEPKNQPITRMSVNNIAMVFAPNILRCPSDNLQVILENTKFEQAFVRTLIQHLKTDALSTMK